MTMYKLMVSAQYFENYAAHNDDWDGVREGWKAKGGVDFAIDMDCIDRLYFSSDDIEAAIKAVLRSKSNLVVRYELAGYEFIDPNPTNITEPFMAELNKIANKEAAKSGEVYHPQG